MEELKQHFAYVDARLKALEQHAHSTHTLDASALDAIATYVIGRINEHLRSVFGWHEPSKSDPPAQTKEKTEAP